ncbi:MAG: hypothetical protein HUN04_02740 [Desulfobacter sp.]|nr:MAG: hypothetical protein HUN04_02740 [Desulfobacter sp.]
MRESKVFKENEVSDVILEPENTVFPWIIDTVYEMIHAQGHQTGRKCYEGDKYIGDYFKITIECFGSKKELELNREIMDRLI